MAQMLTVHGLLPQQALDLNKLANCAKKEEADNGTNTTLAQISDEATQIRKGSLG